MYASSDPTNLTDPTGLIIDTSRLKPWLMSVGRWLGERARGNRARSRIEEYRSLIDMAAADFGVDPALMCTIAFKEMVHMAPGEAFLEYRGLGRTVGIGQIHYRAHGYDRQELFDPATNFRAMAEIVSGLQAEGLIDPARPAFSLGARYNGTGDRSIIYGNIVERMYREYAN